MVTTHSSPTVAPTAPGGRQRSEGPHLASTARKRNILLAIIFLPPVGAVLSWLAPGWPTWARVIATIWTLLVIGFVLAMAFDVFGPRGQGNVSASAVYLSAVGAWS
jgi:hypothetical protein